MDFDADAPQVSMADLKVHAEPVVSI